MDLVWQHLGRPEFTIPNSWSKTIAELERKSPGILPNVRNGSVLIIASDYSGQHKGSPYEVMSFLIADLENSECWDTKRQYLRKKLLPNNRRMSFKGLNDKFKRDALASFLDASNDINGIVVTLAIDRQLPSLFTTDQKIDMTAPECKEFTCFSTSTFERLLRIVDFVSLFLAGLSAPMQDVLWFSDEDEIVSNEERVRIATQIFGRIASHYLPHMLQHMRFGSTKCDDGSLRIEDFTSLPDLAAGAYAEYLTLHRTTGTQLGLNILVPPPINLSIKTRYILSWLANTTCPLKKLAGLITQGDKPGFLKTQWLELNDVSSQFSIVLSRKSLYKGSIFRSNCGTDGE